MTLSLRESIGSGESILSSAEWISIHAHLDAEINSREYEMWLLEEAVPAARGCIARGFANRWFFVRYGDGGPHIRLRVQSKPLFGNSTRECLLARLQNSREVELRPVPYEAEVVRYGGQQALELAEEYFMYSSEFAACTLDKIVASARERRFLRAIAGMFAVGRALHFTESEAAEFFRHYAEGYAQMQARGRGTPADRLFARAKLESARLHEILAATWHACSEPSQLDDQALGAFAQSSKAYVGGLERLHREGNLFVEGNLRPWSQCVRPIVGSIIHMTNNRLGVSPVEEGYLAAIAAFTLTTLC